MESKVNYKVVGFFVVALSAIAILIALWLSVGLKKTSYKTYLVYMNESVSGLNTQAAVQYNGVPVGYVSALRLNPTDPRQVIVELRIQPDTPITDKTNAVLMQQGLTGIAYLGLETKEDHGAALIAKSGQPYPVIKSSPSFLLRLDKTIEGLSQNINLLSDRVQLLLNKDNLANVQKILKNVNDFTGTLAKNTDQLDKSMQSLTTLLQNAATASKQFPDIFKSIDSVSNNINRTSKNANNAIQGFSDQITPETYSLLQNINGVTDNLQGFTKQLRENPSAIISGQQRPPKGPGE